MASLGGAPPTGRIYQPRGKDEAGSLDCGWQRPRVSAEIEHPADDTDGVSSLRPHDQPAQQVEEDDPEIHVIKRDDIVPIRRGAIDDGKADDGFWSSHLFWKGIVLGAAVVLLVKTVLEVQAPFGIDWYQF